MSESEGLKKLTEYLNQTRRQAESAIDVLNDKISELQTENGMLVKMVERLEDERDHYRELYEKVKNESGVKWKLQERDDWKALVDSVQNDRGRLQEQCNCLETELENSKLEIDSLREQLLQSEEQLAHIIRQQQSNNSRIHSTGLSTPERHNDNSSHMRLLISDEDNNTDASSPQFSPIFDRSGKEMPFSQSDPPKVVARALKVELKKANTQIEIERRRAEEQSLLQKVEITRLREELNSLLPNTTNHMLSVNANSTGNINNNSAVVALRGTGNGSGATDTSWFSFVGSLFFPPSVIVNNSNVGINNSSNSNSRNISSSLVATTNSNGSSSRTTVSKTPFLV